MDDAVAEVAATMNNRAWLLTVARRHVVALETEHKVLRTIGDLNGLALRVVFCAMFYETVSGDEDPQGSATTRAQKAKDLAAWALRLIDQAVRYLPPLESREAINTRRPMTTLGRSEGR